MKLRLYMTVPSTEALGPGKRYAIWVQGCNKRCDGCISPDSRDINGGYEMPVADLAADILATPEIEGITISGGEPFLQQDALCELVDLIHEKRNLGVIVYTGMKYSEIADTALASRCDLIIDGEYIEELNDGKSLRGSSNQNVICVSDRYKNIVHEYYGIEGRKIELIFSNGKLRMVGIPSTHVMSEILDFKGIKNGNE